MYSQRKTWDRHSSNTAEPMELCLWVGGRQGAVAALCQAEGRGKMSFPHPSHTHHKPPLCPKAPLPPHFHAPSTSPRAGDGAQACHLTGQSSSTSHTWAEIADRGAGTTALARATPVKAPTSQHQLPFGLPSFSPRPSLEQSLHHSLMLTPLNAFNNPGH